MIQAKMSHSSMMDTMAICLATPLVSLLPGQQESGLRSCVITFKEDRQRLESMTEKEREQEIFRRLEQREALKTRCVE